MILAEGISVRRIARHDVTLQLRDGRMVLAAVALFAALSAAMLSGWMQYESARMERTRFEAAARDQWLHQGARHPHRAAHFGTYVAKPELPLAAFDPGLRPFAGQTLWLEAHDRPAFTNVPAEDDLTLQTGLGVTSGANVLQMLGGLLALVIGALAIVRDRESGVLRLALAQGVSPMRFVVGKLVASGTLLAIPLVPAALLGLLVATVASPVDERSGVFVRGLWIAIANGGLLLTMLMVGFVISVRSRTARAALITAFGLWTAMFVLVPRAGAALAAQLAPTPSLAQYQDANSKVFDTGFDARGGYMTQLDALRAKTLAQYHVQKVDDLPIGFSGVRMRHLDAWGTEVDDRGYAHLQQVYKRQADIRLAAAAIAPFAAVRSFSQGMAGMDWPHYGDFLVAAERYRRGFGARMNALLEQRVRGDRWEMDGSNRDWATVTPFSYDTPRPSWAVRRQMGNLVILLVWFMGGAVALLTTSRRLRP